MEDCKHICFFVFNGVLALNGLALFSYGSFILTNDKYYDSTTLTDISIGGAGVATGIFIFLVVAFGFYAIIKKHKLLFYLYIFLLGLLSVTIFALTLKSALLLMGSSSDKLIMLDTFNKMFGELISKKDPTKILAKMEPIIKHYGCSDFEVCLSKIRDQISVQVLIFTIFSFIFVILGHATAWYSCCIAMDMDEFYD